MIKLLFLVIFFFHQHFGSGLPGEFLYTFTTSAHASGMGKSSLSMIGEPGGIYFNPALLNFVRDLRFSLFYSSLFFGTQSGSFNFAVPISERESVGLSYLYLGSGEVEKFNSLGEPTGEKFQDLYNVIFFSLGRNAYKNFYFGLNIKLVSQLFDDLITFGFGLDAGVIFLPIKNLSIGTSFNNLIPPTMRWPGGKDTYPQVLRYAMRMTFLRERLSLACDLAYSGEELKYFGGSEYIILSNPVSFAIRGGVNYKELAAGFGVMRKNFSFDFAFSYHFKLGATYHLSFSYSPILFLEKLPFWEKEKAKNYYEIGLKKYKEGNLQEAKENLLKSLSIYSDYLPASSLLSEVEKKIELEELAKKKLEEANSYWKKVLEFLDRGEFDYARKNLNIALDTEFEYIKGLIEKQENELLKQAEQLVLKQKYTNAEKALRKVLFFNPFNEKAKEMLKKIKEILEIFE